MVGGVKSQSLALNITHSLQVFALADVLSFRLHVTGAGCCGCE